MLYILSWRILQSQQHLYSLHISLPDLQWSWLNRLHFLHFGAVPFRLYLCKQLQWFGSKWVKLRILLINLQHLPNFRQRILYFLHGPVSFEWTMFDQLLIRVLSRFSYFLVQTVSFSMSYLLIYNCMSELHRFDYFSYQLQLCGMLQSMSHLHRHSDKLHKL